MLERIAVAILLLSFLSSCAVYDPHRGVFVSSSVTTLKIDAVQTGRRVIVLPFTFEATPEAITQQSTFMVDGAFIPISHTYVFDEVDQNNLRESLLQSLRAVGVDAVEATSAGEGHGETLLSVSFTQIGLAPGPFGSFRCVMAGQLSATSQGRTVGRPIQLVGKSMGSVSGAKNDAIKQFVNTAAGALGELR